MARKVVGSTKHEIAPCVVVWAAWIFCFIALAWAGRWTATGKLRSYSKNPIQGKSTQSSCEKQVLNLEVSKRWFTVFYIVGISGTLIALFLLQNPAIISELHILPIDLKGFNGCGGVSAASVWSAFVGASGEEVSTDNTTGSCGGTGSIIGPVLILVLLLVHLTRRLMESLLVTRFSDSRMHITLVAAGLAFYVLVVASILLEVPWQQLSSTTQHISRGNLESIGASEGALVRAMSLEWAGLAPRERLRLLAVPTLWAVANARQHSCARILANIRSKEKQQKSTQNYGSSNGRQNHVCKKQYAIPHGGLFDVVCCPHFLWEITVYLSFVLACPYSISVWMVFLFVLSNQVQAGNRSYQWYKKNFEDFGNSRYRLFPFLW